MTTLSQTPAIPGSPYGQAAKSRDPRMWKTATDFESMFLENMLGHMTSGLSGEGPLAAEGAGGEVWRGMLVKEYAGHMAKAGGVGVADSVYRELIRLQGGSHASA
jgi:Rod binding domain-containing protein